jgi:hypothetical protein
VRQQGVGYIRTQGYTENVGVDNATFPTKSQRREDSVNQSSRIRRRGTGGKELEKKTRQNVEFEAGALSDRLREVLPFELLDRWSCVETGQPVVRVPLCPVQLSQTGFSNASPWTRAGSAG